MIVTIVDVLVKPDCIDAFKAASLLNHLASVQEAGNMRFDILQSESDSSRFTLYEAYESKAHAAAHKETAHYLAWRETVADMMAAPRKGTAFLAIAPNH